MTFIPQLRWRYPLTARHLIAHGVFNGRFEYHIDRQPTGGWRAWVVDAKGELTTNIVEDMATANERCKWPRGDAIAVCRRHLARFALSAEGERAELSLEEAAEAMLSAIGCVMGDVPHAIVDAVPALRDALKRARP